MAEVWIVEVAWGAHGCSTKRPLSLVTRRSGPKTDCAAVAPRQTIYRGFHQRDFSFQPGPARLQFSAIRLLVNAPLAAFFELEVFDGIRNVDCRSIDACVVEGPIEKAASRSDEGLTLAVFFVARLLADENY